MIDSISRLGERLFPERQILIRSRGKITHLTLPSLLQAGVVTLALAGVGVAGAGILTAQDRRAAEELTQLKQQLAQAKEAAGAADARLHALDADRQARGDAADAAEAAAAADAATLSDKIKQLQANLDQSTHQNAESRSLYERAVAQLDKLTGEQKKLKADQDKMKADQEKLAAEKGKLQSRVGELEDEKDKEERSIAGERDKLKQKVAELEQKLKTQPALVGLGPTVGQVAANATAGAAESGADVELTNSKQIASAESFDLDKFLGSYGLGMRQAGVGGPFVALAGGKPDPKAEETARKALAALPLTAPLEKYNLESGFGGREDPINGRRAFHSGLDMSAPYQSPVYATAPGTVVFAGYAAAYGKMVEIDHGNGIHTKYAHLNRIMVNVGQKLVKRGEIGLLGSSGRSTGPHVHYEVTVNGVPQDPEKFLEAGEKVLHAAAQPGVIKASAH